MGALTVKRLAEACEKMIAKGYGNRVVWISSDDEGNDFHRLFYEFTPLDDSNIDDFNMFVRRDELDKDRDIILG